MAFSRIKYDDDSYNLKLEREISPLDYRLFNGFNESCDKCLNYDGYRNNKSDVSLGKNLDPNSDNQWGSLAEIESYLSNRVNKLKNSNVYGKNDHYKNIPTINKHLCNNNLQSEDTRFTYPIEAFRSLDTTSYKFIPYLSVNPQCQIETNEAKIGLNSRLRVRDTFVPTKPTLADQSVFLPAQGNNTCNNIYPTTNITCNK